MCAAFSPVVVEPDEIVSLRRPLVREADGGKKRHPKPIPPGGQELDDHLGRRENRDQGVRIVLTRRFGQAYIRHTFRSKFVRALWSLFKRIKERTDLSCQRFSG